MTTHLQVLQVGRGFFVLRVTPAEGRSLDALEIARDGERLGVHGSKRAATTAARKISATTGEDVRTN